MKTVSISQLRSNIKKHLDEVTKSGDILIVPRNSDDDAVVIMSIKDYNALNETGHLLSTASNRQRLKASIGQLQEKKTLKFNLK